MHIPPVKQTNQLPEVLIYHKPGTCAYRMTTTFMPRVVGEMRAYPIERNNKKSLWIDFLIIFQKRFGFGTKFLDFAQHLSRQTGCNGNISLKAGSTVYDPTKPPHEFYRKYGFGSENKKMLRKIDRAINSKTHLNYKKTPPIIMYFPDNEKPSLLQKLLTKLYL